MFRIEIYGPLSDTKINCDNLTKTLRIYKEKKELLKEDCRVTGQKGTIVLSDPVILMKEEIKP